MKTERLRRVVRKHRWVVLALAIAPVLCVWEWLDRAGHLDPRYWDSPSEIIKTLVYDLSHGQSGFTDQNGARPLSIHLLFTLGRWAMGFAIAAVLGIVSGFILGISRTFHAMGYPFVNLLRSLPSAALWSVCGLLLTFSGSQPIVIVFGTLWPILINTAGAIRSVPQEVHDSIAFIDLERWRRSYILLRWASPGILTGLEIGCAVAFLLTVTVEILWSANGGLGWYIEFHREAQKPAAVFAGLFLIAFVGLVLNSLISAAKRRAVFWEGYEEETTRPPSTKTSTTRLSSAVGVFWPALRQRRLMSDVHDSRLASLLVADRVSAEARRQFPEGFAHTTHYAGVPPYKFPVALRMLLRGELTTDDLFQRDVVLSIRENEMVEPTVILFTRSWSNLGNLSARSRAELRGNLGTTEDILERNEKRLDFKTRQHMPLVSKRLGSLFGIRGSVQLIRRERLILVEGVPSVLIHDYVPVHSLHMGVPA